MFDTKAFLRDYFATPSHLVAFLRVFGVDAPNEETVTKWFRRQSVPSGWLVVLLAYLELDRGGPVSLSKYLGVRTP